MYAAVALLGADVSGRPNAGPETTGDYIVLYVGLALVLILVVAFVVRARRR
jgi:hypothetical protein